jgi:hippurate hydrolase
MIESLVRQIAALAASQAPTFVAVRRHLHAHPELSFEEVETSKYIQDQLKSFGIPFQVMGGTGVIGTISGINPSRRMVALRADMDALPIDEANEVPYRSTRPGVMHACGHDVHTACLLGAAKILQELRTAWEGTVRLIFQPGEEKNPGGASILIREGVLENPVPQAIFGLHVHPGLPAGKLSFRGGMVMASADELHIGIRAKGGHAASPQATADAILAGSHLVMGLQQIISRNNDPFNPSVLSITAFNGGNTTNVLPSTVQLLGTFRAMNEEWRFRAHELIRRQAAAIASGMGVEIDMRIDIGYPCVVNDESLSAAAAEKAAYLVGKVNVEVTELRMGAEDFAFYTHRVPGCFFRLGVGNKEKGIVDGVHTPTFNIDESAIETGMGALALMGAAG